MTYDAGEEERKLRREKGVVVVATVFLNWLCPWVVVVVVVDHLQPEIVQKGQFNPKVKKRTTMELVPEKEEFTEPQKRRDDGVRSHHLQS